MTRQVLALAIQIQAVFGEPAGHHGIADRALQRDDDVGLAPRQLQHARHGQQVDGQQRVALGQNCQVLGQDLRAETLGHTNTHHAAGRVAALVDRYGRNSARDLVHGLGARLQLAAGIGQLVAAAFAGEQGGA